MINTEFSECISACTNCSLICTECATSCLKEKDLEMSFFYSLLRKSYRGDLPNVKKFRIPPTLLELIFNRFIYNIIKNIFVKL